MKGISIRKLAGDRWEAILHLHGQLVARFFASSGADAYAAALHALKFEK